MDSFDCLQRLAQTRHDHDDADDDKPQRDVFGFAQVNSALEALYNNRCSRCLDLALCGSGKSRAR
jgi:hypothetical protein